MNRPVTVVETNEFQRRAKTLFLPEDIQKIIEHVAYFPTSGVVMPGTGGVRKLRWAFAGKGKRGGARIVYYYHDNEIPVFLLSAYAKGAKIDLLPAERRELKRIVSLIIAEYKERDP